MKGKKSGIIQAEYLPLVLFGIALVLLTDVSGVVRLGFLCSCLHECGHLVAWLLLTHTRPRLILCPTGFRLSLQGIAFPPWQMVFLASAGPMVNLFCAAIIIFWLQCHPASYLLCYFIAANILLGAFNLLPVHGLDGWQIFTNLHSWLLKQHFPPARR